jgi:hypothetical protein
MTIEKLLTDKVRDAVFTLISASRGELIAQGHRLTGNLVNSFEQTITFVGGSIKAEVFVADYGLIIDGGVKPSRIPYNRGSGARTSKYIEALIEYWRKRGLNELAAKRAAFATAAKQKQEGMPTRDSYRYSTNGRRLDWRKHASEASKDKILDALNFLQGLKDVIDTLIELN